MEGYEYLQLVSDLLPALDIEDFETATGFVLEYKDPSTGFDQLIGPFSKDNVDALSQIEQLRAEEDPERDPNEPKIEYSIKLLFRP
jgi:hypothetical protein